MNVRYESWSGEEIIKYGMEKMVCILRSKAIEKLPKVAIFSRFVTPHGKALIALCKSLDILTIFHIDDLLQQVPADIGQKYAGVYSETYMAHLRECIVASDGVIASTPILSAQLAKLYPRQSIRTAMGICYVHLPGWSVHGIRSRVARIKRKLLMLGVQTIGYMGSSSHVRDLATITHHIADVMRAHPKLHFETLGLPAPDILKAEFGDRIREYGYTRSYVDFLNTLYELDWDLGLAPLVRDEFNCAKTATKFIEYTACGIPTLAEDIETYSSISRKHNAISVVSGIAWVKATVDLLSNPRNRNRQLQRAKTLCGSSFTGIMALRQMLAAVDQISEIKNQASRKLKG